MDEKHGNLIVFDLETTGLRPSEDLILEIGAVRIEDGEVAQTFHRLIDPKIQIPYRIQQLTGITQAMAEEQGTDGREALQEFIAFCPDVPILGHNIRFDYSFVKHKATRIGLEYEKEAIDTLQIARKALPELPSKSLDALCRHYHIEQKQAHRALDDAMNTWFLYQKLREEFYETMPEIFAGKPMNCKIKRYSPITEPQKGYLKDLTRYHKIKIDTDIDSLSKNEASRMIDGIIRSYGKIMR